MPFDTLRFIHAAGVLLDHAPHDVGTVSVDVRSGLLDATLTSFERIIAACVEHEVDFLLLTGNTFDEQDRSLRARVALREGFDCLNDAGIPVFVVPGPTDPASAWQSVSGLTENVTLFVPDVDEPTAIMRNGHVVATLQTCPTRSGTPHVSDHDPSEPMGRSRIAPFRIGIIPPFSTGIPVPPDTAVSSWLNLHAVDYLAVPRPFQRLWIARPDRVAHCPGPATSLTRADVGPLGCSLVTVEGRNSVSRDHITTSPVRRECLKLAMPPEMTWDELIQAMQESIDTRLARGISVGEILLLDWQFNGSGVLYDSLASPETVDELFELFAVDSSISTDRFVSQRLTLRAAGPGNETSSDHYSESSDTHWESSSLTATGSEHTPSLAASFRDQLNSESAIVRAVLERWKSLPGAAATTWLERLDALASRVDQPAVAERISQLAAEWFATPAAPDQEDSAFDNAA